MRLDFPISSYFKRGAVAFPELGQWKWGNIFLIYFWRNLQFYKTKRRYEQAEHNVNVIEKQWDSEKWGGGRGDFLKPDQIENRRRYKNAIPNCRQPPPLRLYQHGEEWINVRNWGMGWGKKFHFTAKRASWHASLRKPRSKLPKLTSLTSIWSWHSRKFSKMKVFVFHNFFPTFFSDLCSGSSDRITNNYTFVVVNIILLFRLTPLLLTRQ